MKKLNVSLLTTVVGSLLLQTTLASAASKYIWSSSKGIQKATNCSTTSQEKVPFYVIQKNGKLADGIVTQAQAESMDKSSLKQISDSVLELKDSGSELSIEGQKLTNTFLQAAFDGPDHSVFVCKNIGYVVFNVFVHGQEKAIAQLAFERNDAGVLSKAKVHSVDDATQIATEQTAAGAGTMTMNAKAGAAVGTVNSMTMNAQEESEQDSSTAVAQKPVAAQQQQQAPAAQAQLADDEAAPRSEISNKNFVICSPTEDIRVRDENLTKVLFSAKRLEKIQPLQAFGSGKKFQVDGKSYSFLKVQFVARNKTGYVDEQMVKASSECGGSSVAAPVVTAPVAPKPVATTVNNNNDDNSSNVNLQVATCASRQVLSAAKVAVKRRFGYVHGRGLCALGVRLSLQASGVGGISGALGNAIDLIAGLKRYGYVDIGVMDARKIPAGAVMIFSGPYTQQYFRTGKMSRPYGNYVGHITIKGDDGFYYTDGRESEPAMGWSNDTNVSGIRKLAAVMVPGSSLVQKYAGTCNN